MSNSTKAPRPPAGLGSEGKRLWREITRDVAAQGIELDAREAEWLRSAATIADRVAVLEAAVAGADLVVKGVAGQPVAHPLLPEIRLHRQLAAQILARLKVDVAEVSGIGPIASTNRFRKAALARHYGAG